MNFFIAFSAAFFHFLTYICWYELINRFKIANSQSFKKKSWCGKFEDIGDFLDRTISKWTPYSRIFGHISKNLGQQKKINFCGGFSKPFKPHFSRFNSYPWYMYQTFEYWQEPLIFKFICEFASWAKLLPSFKSFATMQSYQHKNHNFLNSSVVLTI